MYRRMDAMADPDVGVNVEVSFMEIYNENVFDLLNPGGNKSGLKVRNHPTTGPYVEDLSRLAVTTYPQIEQLMDEGSKARTVASTNMNATSSRSHAVFSIVLTVAKASTGRSMVSKIHMVDLAGSERATATGASGQRLKEGANINKSLSTLGKVIAALAKKSDGKKNTFVPYRDSVLTWLLKESLGGNSKTIMLAALSPADINFEETLSTLRYADSAKQIKNAAVVNEDPTEKLIRELQEEVERLRQLLADKEKESIQAAAALAANGVSPDGVSGDGASEISVATGSDVSTANGTSIVANGGSEAGAPNTDSLQEIRSQIAQSTKLITNLGKSWETKLAETDALQKERTEQLSMQGLAPSSMVDSNLPNLVNLNEDPLLSGSLVYYLRNGETRVGQMPKRSPGNSAASTPMSSPRYGTILLGGLGVANDHCSLIYEGGEVWLHPRSESATFVNGIRLTAARKLTHGCRVIIGANHIFRFNYPEGALRRNDGDLSPTSSERAAANAAASAASSSLRPIDYKFALEERAAAEIDTLMANSLHFDLTSDEEKRLEKQMKEYYDQKHTEMEDINKQLEALKKSKDSVLDAIDYEQTRQELAARKISIELELSKQKEKFASFSFKVWNEKLERQQLREIIGRVVLLVDEANTISRELNKQVHYELVLRSAYPTTSPAEDLFEAGFGLYKRMIVEVRGTDLRDGRTFVWSQTSFQDLMEDIRAIYADYLTADDDEVDKFIGPVAVARDTDSPGPNGVTDSLMTAAAVPTSSPFSIPSPEDSLRMFTHVTLRDLLYLNHTSMTLPILDTIGKVCGQLHVELDRIAGDADSKSSGTADQLLGKEVEIALRINKATGLDLPIPSLYCAYTFWNSSSYKTEIGALSSDSDSTGETGATLNFFHEERFIVSDVPEDFLGYLENDPLVIELWAVHGTEAIESEAKVNTSKQNLEALRKAYAASQEDGVTFADGAYYPSSSELSPQQEHKEDRFRMLASILIQESLTAPGQPTEYKNVMTKQEPWNNASVQFRLKKHVRAPRRIVFQTAQLKGHPISIESCDQVTLSIAAAKPAQTGSPVPGSTAASSSDAIAPVTIAAPVNVITLKILSVSDERIECEWEDTTGQSLSPIVSAANSGPNTPRRRSRSTAVPIQAPIPIDFGDKDRGSRSPARPSAAEPPAEPQSLVGELTFSLKLNRIAVPVRVSKSFSLKFIGAERVKTLNRTVSEAQLIEDLKMKEVIKTQEEQLALSGAHFQVTLLQYRTIVKDISAMIEEQKYLQKLVGATLLHDRLLNELALVEKLGTLLSLNTLNKTLSVNAEGSAESEPETSPFVQLRHHRTKEDVIRRVDLVKQRINELSAIKNRDDEEDDIQVQVTTSDINHRMESKVCGILLKKAGKIWKPRWCVLTKLYFSVFRTEEEDETPKDILDLTNARINDTSSQRYPHSFAIVNWKDVWFFQAQNAEDFKRWMEALDPERVLRDTQATKEKSLQAKLEAASKSLKEANDQVKSTTAELTNAQETIETREDEIVVLTNEVEKLHAELKEMEQEIDSLVDSKKTSAKPSADDDLDTHEEEILILNNEIEELRDKIATLELELLEAKEGVTGDEDTRDDELLLLREEVEVLREKVKDLEESKPASTDATSEPEKADDPRDAKILALTAELEDNRLRVEELEEELKKVQSDRKQSDAADKEDESSRADLQDEIDTLKRTIDRLKATIDESDAQLDEGTKDLESQLAKQRTKFETQVTDLEEEVDTRDKTIKSMKRDVDQKANELEKLTSEVEIARKAEEDAIAQIEDLRKKHSTSAESLSEAESQLSQKERELARKDKELSSKSEDIEALEKQVSKLREAARSASSSAAADSEEPSRARPNRSADRAELTELKATISKLKDEVKKKDDEIHSIEYEQSKTLKDATNDLKSTIDLQKFDLEQKEREIARLAAQLTKKDQRITTLELDVEQGEEMLEELKAASTAKDKTISAKQKEIEQRDRQIHQLKQAAPQDSNKDAAAFAAAAARRELLAGKEPVEEEDSEKRRRESQMNRLKTNNARLQAEVDEISATNADLKSRLKESKRAVSTAQRESSRKDAQLASKTRQLDDASKKLSEVEKELIDREKAAAEQRRVLASKDRDIYDLESQVDEWKAKWDASKRTVEDKDRLVEDKQQEVEEIQSYADDIEIELARTERELSDAQRNLQELDGICYDLQSRLDKAHQDLSDIREDDSKQRLTRDHKQQVSQLTQDIEARDQDLDRADKVIKQLEKTLEKRDAKLADMESRLEASKSKMESSLSRNASESVEISNLKRDLSSKDTAIERLKDEINDLQRELKREKRRNDSSVADAAPAPSTSSRRRRAEESSDAASDDARGSSKNEERLKSKLDEATKTIVRLEAEVSRRQTQVERLERDRTAQKSVLEDLEASVKTSQRATSSVSSRSSRSDDSTSKAAEELEELKKEVKKSDRQHKNDMAEKENEIDRLQRRLEHSQQALRSRDVRDRNAAISTHVPEPETSSDSKGKIDRETEKELFDLREKVIDLQRALRTKTAEVEEASSGSKRESTQVRRAEERFDAERSELTAEKRQLQKRVGALESEVSHLQSRLSSRSTTKSDDPDTTPTDWQFRAKQAEKELEELRRSTRTASPLHARLPLYPDIHTKVLQGEVDLLRESTGSKTSKIRELRTKEKDLQQERAQLKSESIDLLREKSDATNAASTNARQAARLQDQVSSLEKRLEEVQRSEKSLRKQNDSLLDERVTLVLAVKKAQIEVLAATGERLAVTLPVDLMV